MAASLAANDNNNLDAQSFLPGANAAMANGFSMKLIPGYSKWKLKDIAME